MDNYGTHETASIRSWLARHPRIDVHITPTSASWLNQIGRWFTTLLFVAQHIALHDNDPGVPGHQQREAQAFRLVQDRR